MSVRRMTSTTEGRGSWWNLPLLSHTNDWRIWGRLEIYPDKLGEPVKQSYLYQSAPSVVVWQNRDKTHKDSLYSAFVNVFHFVGLPGSPHLHTFTILDKWVWQNWRMCVERLPGIVWVFFFFLLCFLLFSLSIDGLGRLLSCKGLSI